MKPKNLQECFDLLKDFPGMGSFKKMPEDQIAAKYHFNLGMHLRNEWGLWDQKSELYKYFAAMGLFHPDDMSGVILLSFHRHLNGKELKVEEQIEKYKNYWAKLKEKGIE